MKRCARQQCTFVAHMIAMGIGALASSRLVAQDSPPAGADVLQEVVVTAQKRSEDVQKVRSPSAFCREQMFWPQGPYMPSI